MIKQYLLGHRIDFNWLLKKWYYVDNNEIIQDCNKSPRPCIKCGKLQTKDGHDNCLGRLPGIKSACCGHGIVESYKVVENA